MPKVVYTATKGLYQESGSGFEVGGTSIIPTQTSMATYCIDFDGFNQGGTGSGTAAGNNTDGAFFVLSDRLQTKVFWFTDSAESTPATQPTAAAVAAAGFTGQIDAYVTIETNSVTSANDVVDLIKTAVNAALGGTMTDNSDGTASYDAEAPYVPKAAAHVGNMETSAITVNNAGLGSHNSYTLNAYGVNYIDMDGLDQMTGEDAYILPDGSDRGQEVTIIMSLDNSETHTMTGKIQKTAVSGDVGAAAVVGGLTGQGGTTATFTGVTSNVASLVCMWDGIQWIIKGGYSVAVA